MATEVIVDLSTLYQGQAKLAELPDYQEEVKKYAGQGQVVILTGPAPVWLYLKVAHTLHGLASRLIYRSPVSGDVEIFNHSPF